MAASAQVKIVLLLLCGLVSSAVATIYNVGGDGGWAFQSESTFYDDQFKNIILFAGDSSTGDGLNFTFAAGHHNVIEVPPENVATCDSTTNTINTYTDTVTIYSSTPGTVGFICGFPNHCSRFGMHLIVTFVSAFSPAPSPAPTPSAGMSNGRGGYN